MTNKIIIVGFMVCVFAWQAHAAVNCTAAGRFADPDDTTCQNYTLCVYSSSTGSYLAYNYVCPTSSVFNPATSLCTASSNYICNVTTTTSTTTTTTTSTTTTTTSTTTEAPTTNTSVCTSDGFVADPSSTNCSSFIECVDINGTFSETTMLCPDDTFYNPNTTLCEPDYNCTNSDSFNCTTPGRFADTTDSTCQSYYFCVLLSNGSYTQYNYTCPSISMFDPTESLCTTNYTCSS